MGFFSSLFKKNANKPIQTKLNEPSPPVIEKRISSYYTEVKLASDKTISRVSLDGYRSPSGGYLNWAEFKVIGINPKTNRKNTRSIKAVDQDAAIMVAEKELLSPSISAIIPHTAPTCLDLEEAHDLGITVPDNACSTDISCMMDRVYNYDEVVSEKWISDDTKLLEVIPSPASDERLAKFAHNKGIRFSMYIREENLISSLFYELNDYDRAAFAAFYILRSINHEFVDNYGELNKFAEYAIAKPSLMKSIIGREQSDYYKPHKGSVVYKEVLNFFNIK